MVGFNRGFFAIVGVIASLLLPGNVESSPTGLERRDGGGMDDTCREIIIIAGTKSILQALCNEIPNDQGQFKLRRTQLDLNHCLKYVNETSSNWLDWAPEGNFTSNMETTTDGQACSLDATNNFFCWTINCAARAVYIKLNTKIMNSDGFLQCYDVKGTQVEEIG